MDGRAEESGRCRSRKVMMRGGCDMVVCGLVEELSCIPLISKNSDSNHRNIIAIRFIYHDQLLILLLFVGYTHGQQIKRTRLPPCRYIRMQVTSAMVLHATNIKLTYHQGI